MLEEQQPDLVDICLPTRFHEAVTVEALQKGYFVLCEKTMADDFADGVLSFDGKNVFFTYRNGHRQNIELPDHDGIVGEIGYFVRLLLDGKPNTVNPPEQSAHTIYLLEKCFESHNLDGKILELEVPYEQ